MIIKTRDIDIYQFLREFEEYNREDNFSYAGTSALFDWLEELSVETGDPYELDVIALCCEFTEYSDLSEIKDVYFSTVLDSIEDLYDHTIVIEFDGGIIIQDF